MLPWVTPTELRMTYVLTPSFTGGYSQATPTEFLITGNSYGVFNHRQLLRSFCRLGSFEMALILSINFELYFIEYKFRPKVYFV